MAVAGQQSQAAPIGVYCSALAAWVAADVSMQPNTYCCVFRVQGLSGVAPCRGFAGVGFNTLKQA